MTIATPALALLAGVLSTLSPCVLPILPVVLGAAATEHRFGPAALGAGLGLSFVAIGLFVATVGFAIGLDAGVFRPIAAVLLLAIGIVLIFPRLQERVAAFAGPISNWTSERFGGGRGVGLGGQFGVGLLLGAVWSPCVGPTLGAAAVLAAQGQNLAQVTITMLLFGLGAALPLVLIGTLSRQVMTRLRGRMLSAGGALKGALGLFLAAAALLVLTGLDKTVEAALVSSSPEWLTQLTTRF
jgi:cytochrome c-type biogenesis protein